MTNRNRLISGDNKGFAAYHWERTVAGADYLDSQPDLITAFAQTNPGDMSPHVDGPITGASISERELDNTRHIGLRQFDDAVAQLGSATPIGTGIDVRLTYVDLSSVVVHGEYTPDGQEHRTGRPMIAAAMVCGDRRGRGFPRLSPGPKPVLGQDIRGHLPVRHFDAGVQAPKAMVLPAHLLNRMHPFVAGDRSRAAVRVGRLYLIGIPGEPTSSRAYGCAHGGIDRRRQLADVLCVGYSNAYIHYVTTPEEYLDQRYEGGSTLFGRWNCLLSCRPWRALPRQCETAVPRRPAPVQGPTNH